jgi:hypothetical protein
MDYNQCFPANIEQISKDTQLHYLIGQATEWVMANGYLSTSKFLECASVFELTVISQWLEQMPKDIMNLDAPSNAVRNAMALAIVLIIGEGDSTISLSKIINACMNLQEFTVIEIEFRSLGLLEALEHARKHYSVLE